MVDVVYQVGGLAPLGLSDIITTFTVLAFDGPVLFSEVVLHGVHEQLYCPEPPRGIFVAFVRVCIYLSRVFHLLRYYGFYLIHECSYACDTRSICEHIHACGTRGPYVSTDSPAAHWCSKAIHVPCALAVKGGFWQKSIGKTNCITPASPMAW